ncbi:hypothetical protein QKF57_11050 [Clavibacter michiganensis]|uniref:hypothetical protein n=1 Tax=Clavibacter michiganensis TaxID=28447 RepID=UPI0026DB23AB|nr:hypothetical protein [Clavibacter michiganensis]MDO4026215.1 hypothetical protein [Clavibacter michiganensis]MDO4035880.1 hypothetical protein [Clavibacter michiganensis]MDO4048123.1 hypothetical protein [Clavibacter michiganensis]MDO4076016.1 hypothetical protein [Clavibacter michiganensis]MDO4106356.1 hypothetical protein [Clavibacter michiganensis]
MSGVRPGTRTAARPGTRPPGHDPLAGGLRFLAELIAWVATPWALWPHSIPLAVCAVVLLIGLPAVFSTPGDRPGGDGLVPTPGIVTILLVLLQLVAASLAAWAIWRTWIAVAVTALCLAVVVTEQPRWRALTRRR